MNTTAASTAIHTLPPLQPILAELGIPARDLARAARLSRSAASRLVAHGQLPARRAVEVLSQIPEITSQPARDKPAQPAP